MRLKYVIATDVTIVKAQLLQELSVGGEEVEECGKSSQNGGTHQAMHMSIEINGIFILFSQSQPTAHC